MKSLNYSDLSGNPTSNLPGISPSYASMAGLRNINPDEAEHLVGIRKAGLCIPYFDHLGQPVHDDGLPYLRLRLHEPIGRQKYHQRAGSSVHSYLPPSVKLDEKYWIIVEGEKKALALASRQLPAIGISGFYGFKCEDTWSAELNGALGVATPDRIFFLGDKDTLFNADFPAAAIRLAQIALEKKIEVTMVRVPWLAPGKGIDDCIEAWGANFLLQWNEILQRGVPVTAEADKAKLAQRALEMEMPDLLAAPNSDMQQCRGNFVKLCAGFTMSPNHLRVPH